jgi:hypothetical protein
LVRIPAIRIAAGDETFMAESTHMKGTGMDTGVEASKGITRRS